MYIKLGKLTSEHPEVTYSNFNILSEVVNSGISYERPVLVNTAEQLDIWFGREFPESDYLKSLLSINSDNSLYLYRPVSGKYKDTLGLSEYNVDRKIYESVDLIKDPKKNTIYKVLSDSEDGPDEYILYYDSLINVNNLPQNLDKISESQFNRDTLRVFPEGFYSYPRFIGEGEEYYCTDTKWNIVKELSGITRTDILDDIRDGKKSLAFDYSLSIGRSSIIQGTGALLIGGEIYYYNYPSSSTGSYSQEIELDKEKNIFKFPWIKSYKSIDEDGYHYLSRETWASGIHFYNSINPTLSDFFDFVQRESKGKIIITSDRIYTTSPVSTVCFFISYTEPVIPTNLITIKPDFRDTWDIINEYLGRKNTWLISFWSKTIGRSGTDDDDIKISLEKLDTDYYQAIITKYSYKEVFEGSILGTAGDYVRLDSVINSGSNLVRCSVRDRKSWNNLSSTWKLWGAEKEDYTPATWNAGLKTMIENIDRLDPDFLLIPDPTVYVNNLSELPEFYKNTVLNYSVDNKFQTLITNTPETVEYNYTKDKENYLVYFYKTLYDTLDGTIYPGYFGYLEGLYTDTYQISTDRYYYETPCLPDSKLPGAPEETETGEISEKDLVKYKSNYLLDSGKYYYYEKYQDGEKPESTGWMRFCVEKIHRELEKCAQALFGEKNEILIENTVRKYINKIPESFSIIRYINIDNYFLDQGNMTLYLQLSTGVADLIKNDITIDLTVKFN